MLHYYSRMNYTYHMLRYYSDVPKFLGRKYALGFGKQLEA